MSNKEIISWNINKSKENIKKSILKDRIIIFFTRIYEDLTNYNNPNFYGRIKELFLLIYPYSNLENTKTIYNEFKKSNFKSKEGLNLNKEEINYVKNFVESLDSDCKLKNKNQAKIEIENILNKLAEKYLPKSLNLIEPYLLGKLISSVGGIKNLYIKPSSTIQLIGAEKAMFRHITKNKPCPKYGLIYYSNQIKKSKNKGKTARQLANKLAISIKVDYFQNFVQ